MPHIVADYSANLDAELDMSAFCEHLRLAASDNPALPLPGLRVRAIPAKHYAIADGDPKHSYIDISVRLRAGRSDAEKTDVANRLFAAAQDFLNGYMATHSLALSLEVRDIDPAFSPKTGTIRDHLKTTT